MPAFLFTDVEGSTQLLRDHEALWAGLIERQRAIIVRAAEARGGALASSAGDGCFCAFPEDRDGRAAVGAALAAQAALAVEPWPEQLDVRVRMGVHAGPAACVGGEWVGLAVHQAARLGAVGHGTQIVVTAALAADFPGAVPLGRHTIKDFGDELELVQLTAPGGRTSFPPLRTLAVARNNLPLRRTTFVGREDDLAIVGKLIDETRLVSVVGPGGVGKTRLALEVAAERLARHRDGTFLVELSPVSTGGVADAIATAVAAAAPGHGSLAEQLADRALLLVLDNCEHVIDEVAQVVNAVLDRCAEVHVLATSREPLGLIGEALWRVDPLPMPEVGPIDAEVALEHAAIRLLVDRAELARPGFSLDNDAAAALARICRRLDGLPLAIELAAARLGSLTLQELDARLVDRFDVLSGARRSGAPHQRTLDDLVGWSFDLLDDAEQRVLTRLSVFAGAAGARAVEAVCGSLIVLDQLVDRSLVQRDVISGEVRHRLLETVRAVARARLEASGELTDAVLAHLAHHGRLVRDQRSRLHGPDQADAMRCIGRELDEIRRALRVAIDRGRTEDALELAGGIHQFWLSAGFLEEGRRWLAEALAMAGDPDGVARLQALLAAGWLALEHRDDAAAEPLLAEAREVARRTGDLSSEGRALDSLARLAHSRGDPESAEEQLRESLTIRRRVGEPVSTAATLNNLAGLVVRRDPRLASELLSEALELERAAAPASRRIGGLRNLGVVHWLGSHDVDRARAAWSEGLELARRLGDRRLEVRLTQDLGRCDEVEGRLEAAAGHFDRALSTASAIDAVPEFAALLLDRARVARLLGDRRGGRDYAERARAVAHEAGQELIAAGATAELAQLSIDDGDLARARPLVDQALALGADASARIALLLADGDRRAAAAVLQRVAPPGEPAPADGPHSVAERQQWAAWWAAATADDGTTI